MAKFFAVTIIVIAIASAVPILRHTWVAPADISTHGHLIDEQMSETMAEAGISFLAAQFILGDFHLEVFKPWPRTRRSTSFPGGAKGLVIAALLLVGAEVLALGVFGVKAWADVYLTPPSADAMPVQVQAGQFAFYFRYPGPDGKFGPLHPELINEANAKFLWPGSRPRPGFQGRHRDRRNGDPGEQGNPSAHACERCWPFLLCAGVAGATGLCSRPGCLSALHRNQDRQVRNCLHPALWPGALQHEGIPRCSVPGTTSMLG